MKKRILFHAILISMAVEGSIALGAGGGVRKFFKKDLPANFGCGPGNVIMPRDSVLSTYAGSWTNQLVGPLLPLSTTSQLSGCKGGPKDFVEDRAAYQFFVENHGDVLLEISMGGGEKTAGLEQLLGLQPEQSLQFRSGLLARFDGIRGADQQVAFREILTIRKDLKS